MKQRIISGAACVAVLVAVLCLYKTIVWEAAISVLSAIAVYELLSAVGFKKNIFFLSLAVSVAAIIPFASLLGIEMWIAILFAILTVILTLKFHSQISFEKISFYILATLYVSFSFLCLVYLRNEKYGDGLFYVLLCFGGAWFADTGAYFTGRFLGKHKLSPNISPKKTVEGLIGGIVSNVLLLNLMAYVYCEIMAIYGMGVIYVNYLLLSVLAVVVALAGTAGDLIASVIKRQIGIKDYGNLIPGHGGIMDRFDSILFIAPTVYIVTRMVTII